MNLRELLTAPEGKTLEFKRDISSLPPICKTLVAFANTAGGTLIDVPVNVPVNVPINDRQRWLLNQFDQGHHLRASDAATHFSVSEKTVRRDIAALKAYNLIEFVGPPKTGFYRLKEKT